MLPLPAAAVPLLMGQRHSAHELDAWLKRHGYTSTQTPRPYATSSRTTHARKFHQEPTGREVFAAHERHHHITTAGRRALTRKQFALGPGPEERRRGIKGRLPMDTLARARNALTRASQMRERGHITARQLKEVRRAVHRAWPSIEVDD